MEKFVRLDGLVAPLDRNNVDTDAIIPSPEPNGLSSRQRLTGSASLIDHVRAHPSVTVKPPVVASSPRPNVWPPRSPNVGDIRASGVPDVVNA